MNGLDFTELDEQALAIDDGDGWSIAELAKGTFDSVPVLLEALMVRDAWRRAGMSSDIAPTTHSQCRSKTSLLESRPLSVLSKNEHAAFLPHRRIPAKGSSIGSKRSGSA